MYRGKKKHCLRKLSRILDSFTTRFKEWKRRSLMQQRSNTTIRIWPLVILESGGWHDRNIAEVSLPFSFERSWICMTRWVPAQKFTALTVWRFEDRKRGLTIPVDIIGTDSPRGTTLRLEIGRIVRPCFQNVMEMLSSGFLRYYLLESSVLSNEAPHHGG